MIHTLQLSNFKSYKSGLFEFSDGVNIIVGANASGKTNLLEGIHTICQLRSFRSADKQLIRFSEDWSRLEAMTANGVRVVKLQPNEKALEVDDITVRKMTNKHSIPVVVFEPEHMLLLGSEPERRRAYVDTLLSATEPNYHSNLLAYKRILRQRNNILKQPNPSKQELFPWDIQLAEKAGYLANQRIKVLQKLKKAYADNYKAISNTTDELVVKYESTISDVSNEYSDRMTTYLQENHALDSQRGFTGAGPHRDDLKIELNKRDARVSASRGESRSIILALKVAELELVTEATGKTPVLLLDDVFSELDGSRRRALAETLKNYQTFLTTTDADVAVDHFSNYNIIPMTG